MAQVPVISSLCALCALLLACSAPEQAPSQGPEIRMTEVSAYRLSGEDLSAVARAGEARLSPDGSRADLEDGSLLLPWPQVEISAPKVDIDLTASDATGEDGVVVDGPGYQLNGDAFALDGEEATLTLTGSVSATDEVSRSSADDTPPPDPSSEPVEIDADEVVLHRRTNKAVFTGNVVVNRGDYRLTCRKLTVTYGENQRITQLLAEGDVRVIEADRVVTARRADFDVVTEVLTLTGDAVLTQGNNVIRGDRVVFVLGTDEVRVERVRARVRVGDAPSLGETER